MASLADVVAVVSEDGDSGSEEVMPIAGAKAKLGNSNYVRPTSLQSYVVEFPLNYDGQAVDLVI